MASRQERRGPHSATVSSGFEDSDSVSDHHHNHQQQKQQQPAISEREERRINRALADAAASSRSRSRGRSRSRSRHDDDHESRRRSLGGSTRPTSASGRIQHDRGHKDQDQDQDDGARTRVAPRRSSVSFDDKVQIVSFSTGREEYDDDDGGGGGGGGEQEGGEGLAAEPLGLFSSALAVVIDWASAAAGRARARQAPLGGVRVGFRRLLGRTLAVLGGVLASVGSRALWHLVRVLLAVVVAGYLVSVVRSFLAGLYLSVAKWLMSPLMVVLSFLAGSITTLTAGTTASVMTATTAPTRAPTSAAVAMFHSTLPEIRGVQVNGFDIPETVYEHEEGPDDGRMRPTQQQSQEWAAGSMLRLVTELIKAHIERQPQHQHKDEQRLAQNISHVVNVRRDMTQRAQLVRGWLQHNLSQPQGELQALRAQMEARPAASVVASSSSDNNKKNNTEEKEKKQTNMWVVVSWIRGRGVADDKDEALAGRMRSVLADLDFVAGRARRLVAAVDRVREVLQGTVNDLRGDVDASGKQRADVVGSLLRYCTGVGFEDTDKDDDDDDLRDQDDDDGDDDDDDFFSLQDGLPKNNRDRDRNRLADLVTKRLDAIDVSLAHENSQLVAWQRELKKVGAHESLRLERAAHMLAEVEAERSRVDKLLQLVMGSSNSETRRGWWWWQSRGYDHNDKIKQRMHVGSSGGEEELDEDETWKAKVQGWETSLAVLVDESLGALWNLTVERDKL